MHLRKIHVWKIRHEQYPQLLAHFRPQNDLCRFPSILLVWRSHEKITSLRDRKALTEKIDIPTLAVPYFAQFVGKFLKRFIPFGLKRASILPLSNTMKLKRSFLSGSNQLPPKGDRQ